MAEVYPKPVYQHHWISSQYFELGTSTVKILAGPLRFVLLTTGAV